MGSTNPTLSLKPGKYYIDRDNGKWCCFKTDLSAPVHAQAWCVNVRDHQVEYFFLDGRYDAAGKREFTLVKEVK